MASMRRFKKIFDEFVCEMNKKLEELDSEKKKLAVVYVISNVLIEQYSIEESIGLLEFVKHLMLTVPADEIPQRTSYIS